MHNFAIFLDAFGERNNTMKLHRTHSLQQRNIVICLAEEYLTHFLHIRIELHGILGADCQSHRKQMHEFDAVSRGLCYPWVRNDAETSIGPFVHFAASLLAVLLHPHEE